jgi:outer membrane lipoprotein-sorting protein
MRLLSLFVVLALCAGGAFAGCGHKDTVEGKLKSVDSDSNTVVVVVEDGKELKLTLTGETKVTDAEGNDAEASKLVGKEVKVVSEHAKVDSITQIA